MSGQLVGRDRELTALAGLLGQVRAGHGRGVVLLGEAGIGKTSLAEVFADHAQERGFSVSWGRCTEAEAPAYWPWRQALRDLPGALGSELERAQGPGSRPELFASLVEGLATQRDEAPAVIVLEDVHWADAPSLALLRFVADALPGLPLLLVLTARDDPLEATRDARELLRALPAHVERLPLGGLGRLAVGALVAEVLGRSPGQELVARIVERSGGNPFFVREVAQLHALRGEESLVMPPGVQQVLERRLGRLSRSCYELLTIAAVAGGEPEPDLLAEIVGEDVDSVMTRLDEAVAAGLVAVDEGGLRFVHALVREVLYGQQPPGRRGQLHRRVAEALEQRLQPMSPGRSALIGQLAGHWRRAAGNDARQVAAERALVAARDAMTRMGYEQAVRFYTWALEGPQEDELSVFVDLGEASILAGELGAGRETLLRAAALARERGRPRELGQAVLLMGTGVGGFEVQLYDEYQVVLLEEALEGLGGEDLALRAALLARLSLATAGLRPVEERVKLARQATELARRAGDARVELAALAAWCDAEAGPDFVDARLERSREMIAAAERSGDPTMMLLARRLTVVALAERGDFGAVDAEVAAYARTAERLRLPLYVWPVPVWKGMRALMAGDITAARRFADEAADLAGRSDSTNAKLMVTTLRYWLYGTTGEVERLLAQLESELMATLLEHPAVDAIFAGFYPVVGRIDDAGRYVERRLAAGLDGMEKDSEYLVSLWLIGAGAMATGHRRGCELVLEALARYPHRWAVDGIAGAVAGPVSLQLGRLALYLRRLDEARVWLDEASRQAEDVGASLIVAEVEEAIAAFETASFGDALPGAGRAGQDRVREGSRQPASGEFRRVGRIWQLRFRGREVTVPDSKGMRDLAVLLARPEQEVHVLDLVEAAGGPPARAAGGGAGERLDARARAAYRQRLANLEEELAEAEGYADLGRVTALREERRFLADELAGALGLGGRRRTVGDPTERARKAVAMRIRTAIRVIEEVHPDLARHLERSVSTGRFCSYRPETAVTWEQ